MMDNELRLDILKKIDLESLDEATLSRVWQHTTDLDTAFAILTAFRRGRSEMENYRLNRGLASKISGKGYGYFFLEGYFIENEGTPDEVRVVENSIFVPQRPNVSSEQMKKELLFLAKEYGQEAIFFKPAGETQGYLIAVDGTVTQGPLSLSPDKMGKYYSALRGGGRTFTFESAGVARTILGRRGAEARFSK